jgi:hypothetical protein
MSVGGVSGQLQCCQTVRPAVENKNAGTVFLNGMPAGRGGAGEFWAGRTGLDDRRATPDDLVFTGRPYPAGPYAPEHKGKVEESVGHVKANALKGRIFDSLAAENR